MSPRFHHSSCSGSDSAIIRCGSDLTADNQHVFELFLKMGCPAAQMARCGGAAASVLVDDRMRERCFGNLTREFRIIAAPISARPDEIANADADSPPRAYGLGNG